MLTTRKSNCLHLPAFTRTCDISSEIMKSQIWMCLLWDKKKGVNHFIVNGKKEKRISIRKNEKKLLMSWAGLLVGLANCQICRIEVFVLKHRLGKEKEKNSFLLIVIFWLDANYKLSPLMYSPQPIDSSLTLLHAPMTLVQWRACFSWSFLFPLLCFSASWVICIDFLLEWFLNMS